MHQPRGHLWDGQDQINCADVLRERISVSERRAAMRLFDLLDTFVALRRNLGTSAADQDSGSGLGSENIAAVRVVLDQAIRATREIIGDTTRPLPPS
jgi:hypothetical protein